MEKFQEWQLSSCMLSGMDSTLLFCSVTEKRIQRKIWAETLLAFSLGLNDVSKMEPRHGISSGVCNLVESAAQVTSMNNALKWYWEFYEYVCVCVHIYIYMCPSCEKEFIFCINFSNGTMTQESLGTVIEDLKLWVSDSALRGRDCKGGIYNEHSLMMLPGVTLHKTDTTMYNHNSCESCCNRHSHLAPALYAETTCYCNLHFRQLGEWRLIWWLTEVYFSIRS